MLRKVIVVEDDPFSQDYYKIFFKKLCNEVFILENVDSIINEIEKGDVDLIIMDINIKNTYWNSERLDGMKLSNIIKKRFNNLKIPVLLISAYPISAFGDNVLADSMADDYFIKPIYDYNKLIDKINKLVYSKNERQNTNS
ncbi:MAG: response regulator [Ignavibacteriales bacterium]|nr:response regulator [Ignavibacteriales bacterium]